MCVAELAVVKGRAGSRYLSGRCPPSLTRDASRRRILTCRLEIYRLATVQAGAEAFEVLLLLVIVDLSVVGGRLENQSGRWQRGAGNGSQASVGQVHGIYQDVFAIRQAHLTDVSSVAWTWC